MKQKRILLLTGLLGITIATAELTPEQNALILESIDPAVWGAFDANAYPWLKTMDFGWVYFEPLPGTGTFWMWNSDLGWMYSSKELFPEIWIPGLSKKIQSTGWVLFDLTDSKRYKLFVKSRKMWIALPRPKLPFNEQPHTTDLVPPNLRGLSSSWFIPYAAGLTYVGDHYLRISRGDRLSSQLSTYFYNPFDGWFYPWHSQSTVNSSPVILGTGRNFRRANVQLDKNDLVIEWDDLIHGGESVIERLPID